MSRPGLSAIARIGLTLLAIDSRFASLRLLLALLSPAFPLWDSPFVGDSRLPGITRERKSVDEKTPCESCHTGFLVACSTSVVVV